DREPIAIETTFYPATLLPGLLDGDLSGSLWTAISDQYGLTIARTTARLEVIALDAMTATHLGTRQAASGLLLTRQSYLADGRCIEYAQDIYRADRVSLIIDREVDGR
ncbi:MAG TPA: UTRA domain-containing protein, partial [Agrococcus sp.]|nr:UTRA domain-containing protein [Agrococcus sp.]